MAEKFLKKQCDFNFGMSVYKATFDKDTGKHYVFAKASDSNVDAYGDAMSRKALNMMAKDAKKSVPVRRSHDEAFEIGWTVDGRVMKSADRYDFIVKIELNMDFPESKILFEEVDSGKAERQLSVGGFVPIDQEGAIEYKEINGSIVRVINVISLDHIAITAPKFAANPRTGFIDAIVKSVSDKYIQKGIVKFKSFPLADRTKPWSFDASDGNAILLKFSGVDTIDEFNMLPDDDERKIRAFSWYKDAHAWFDDSRGDVPMIRGAYGLPHHKIDDDGEFKTFFRGCVAAIASINGARGGFSRFKSESERMAVYEHLSEHIMEFGAEPPELIKEEKIKELGLASDDIVDIIVKHFDKQGIKVDFLYEYFDVSNSKGENDMSVSEPKINKDKKETAVDAAAEDMKSVSSDCINVVANENKSKDSIADVFSSADSITQALSELCKKINTLDANLSLKNTDTTETAVSNVNDSAEQQSKVDTSNDNMDTKNFDSANIIYEKTYNELVDIIKGMSYGLSNAMLVFSKNLESMRRVFENTITLLEKRIEKLEGSIVDVADSVSEVQETVEDVKKNIRIGGNCIRGQEEETAMLKDKAKKSPLSGIILGDLRKNIM